LCTKNINHRTERNRSLPERGLIIDEYEAMNLEKNVLNGLHSVACEIILFDNYSLVFKSLVGL